MMRVFDNKALVRVMDPPNESVHLVDCPEVLYRYVHAPYDTRFLSGMLRISPLDVYVSIEDAARRDTQEGQKLHRIPEGELSGLPMRTMGYDHPVSAWDNEERVEAPPSYCLCFSHVASRQLAQKFRAQGATQPACCIRIKGPQEFIAEVDRLFREASQHAVRPVTRSFAGPVRYKRGEHARWPFKAGAADPRLIKPFDPFSCEAEFRIVWSVDGSRGRLPPIDVQLRDSHSGLSIIPWDALPQRVECAVPCIDDDDVEMNSE